MTEHDYIDEESDDEECVIISVSSPELFCCVCEDLLHQDECVVFGHLYYCCDCCELLMESDIESDIESDEDADYISEDEDED